MIPSVFMFVQRPVAPGPERRTPIWRDRSLLMLRIGVRRSNRRFMPLLCLRQSEVEANHA